MSMSPHIASLRAHVGHTRLLLPSVTGIVYDPKGRILMVLERDGGIWSTPGGAIEPDETPADAVVREVLDETGLLTAPESVLGVFGGPAFVVRYANGDQSQYVMTVFDCRVLSGELRPDTDETTGFRFVDSEEFKGLPVSPWAHEVLPLLFPRPRRTLFVPPRG